MEKDKKIQFNVNPQKIVEIILWFANKKPKIRFHALLKFLFFADIYHINKYGRPVSGDTYVAMQYGPVASLTYDILKKESLAIELFESADCLAFDIDKDNSITAKREATVDKLSDSDVEALEYAFKKYAEENFRSLTDITHSHLAWTKAREQGGNNPTIEFEDMIDDVNIKEDLKENSGYIKF